MVDGGSEINPFIAGFSMVAIGTIVLFTLMAIAPVHSTTEIYDEMIILDFNGDRIVFDDGTVLFASNIKDFTWTLNKRCNITVDVIESTGERYIRNVECVNEGVFKNTWVEGEK